MIPEPQTLYDVLRNSAREFAACPALVKIGGETVTYTDLQRRSQELSLYLHSRGVCPGERVVLLGENMPHWGIAYFAITSMSAVVVPVLPDFHAKDIANIIRHAEPRAIFVSAKLFEKIDGLTNEERGTTILLDDFTVVPPGTTSDHLAASDRLRQRAVVDQEENGKEEIEILPRPSRDDLAAIVYTSGTTGHSKGVMLTHGNLVANAQGAAYLAKATKEDKLLSILPLPHTYESTLGLITPVLVGASVHYLGKPPTAAVLLPALERVKPTIMLSVPLVIEKIFKGKILPQLTSKPALRRLYRIPFFRRILHRIAGKKLLRIFGGNLHVFTIGGAPLAPDVELFLREGHFPYAIGYGLTETAPLIAGTGPKDTRYRSTGPPVRGTSIRIANPHPTTGEGEIQVKGPTVMKGYYRDPQKTRETFTEDGWLKTGDLGVYDAQGYLYIRGRLKNMILGPSGKNIYPEEIEAIINEFDTVSESIVYEQENRLVALVHLDYERLQSLLQTLSETDVRARANEMLADLHKRINDRVPLFARIHRIIEQAEPFQKTPTQKIKRHLYIPGS